MEKACYFMQGKGKFWTTEKDSSSEVHAGRGRQSSSNPRSNPLFSLCPKIHSSLFLVSMPPELSFSECF